MTDMQEFVVPKSIPRILDIALYYKAKAVPKIDFLSIYVKDNNL